MTSAKIYLILLLSIVGLVGLSGALGLYMFGAAPEFNAVAPSAPAAASIVAAAAEAAAAAPAATPTAAAPAAAPRADVAPAEAAAPSALALASRVGSPILFTENCAEYGGDAGFVAQGGSLAVSISGGQACLDMKRPPLTGQGRTYQINGATYNSSNLDCNVRLCMRVAGSRAPTRAVALSATPAGGAGLSSADRLVRWHMPGAEANEVAAAPRTARTGFIPGYRGITNEQTYAVGMNPGLAFNDVPAPYPTVRYENVYPGIDLSYFTDGSRFELIFTVWPEADPSSIRLTFDGAQGIMVGADGNMDIDLPCGKVVTHAPLVYQVQDGQVVPLNGSFSLQGDAIAFQIADRAAGRAAATPTRPAAPRDPRLPDLVRVPASGEGSGPEYDMYVGRYEVSNTELVRFLNDAQAHTNDARGANMWFDTFGSVWMSRTHEAEREELFSIGYSRLAYDASQPPGARYSISTRTPAVGESYSNHPAAGVSWYGAVKYCNWLTLAAGRGADQRCFREGTNALDWAPVTCAPTNWARGRFTPAERQAWLRYTGFRLPMDNCTSSGRVAQTYLRVSNGEFARFLNDIQTQTASAGRVFIDPAGNAFFNAAMKPGRDDLFRIDGSLLVYRPSLPPGRRYQVVPSRPDDRVPPEDMAVVNVSWFGAMKYANWLSAQQGVPASEWRYREGAWSIDWAPATCGIMPWQNATFAEADRAKWRQLKGVGLPYANLSRAAAAVADDPQWAGGLDTTFTGTASWANPFNEVYKIAAAGPGSNCLYGFGRSSFGVADANYRHDDTPAENDTTPVGFYDGSDRDRRFFTHTNDNRFGIFDLSGNVAEWLVDVGREGSTRDRASYGGAWNTALPTVAQRTPLPPYATGNGGGFRVLSMAGQPVSLPTEALYVVRMPFRICLCPCSAGQEEGRAVTSQPKPPAGADRPSVPVPPGKPPDSPGGTTPKEKESPPPTPPPPIPPPGPPPIPPPPITPPPSGGGGPPPPISPSGL